MKLFKIRNKEEIINNLFIALKVLAYIFIIVPLWAIYIGSFFVPYGIVVWFFLWIFFMIYKLVTSMRLGWAIKGNTITYGGRGKGKGMLFQKVINSEPQAMSNIDFGGNCKVVKAIDYYNSITPNTALKFLKGEVIIIDKIDEYEGVPYYTDDGALLFPNYNDNTIKALYPSITLLLPALRHLYGTYNPIQAQSIERLYKPLRELQDDGYIKALRTYGKAWLWRKLPIIRKYFVVKWRYYENLESALKGKLPFSRMGITNEIAKRVYMTTASAMKEQYNSENGEISQSLVFIKRKSIKYDTREYHKTFFGISYKEWKQQKDDEKKEKLQALANSLETLEPYPVKSDSSD